jgi:hypothetical protein
MAAGLPDHVWTMEEIIALVGEAAPKLGRPKTYKKRAAQQRLLSGGFGLPPGVSADAIATFLQTDRGRYQ